MDYMLKLTPEHIQVIGKALEEMPFKFAAPVVAAIQSQINEQEAQANKPPPEPAVATAELG